MYVDANSEGLISFAGQINYDDKIFEDWYRFDVFRSWDPKEGERVDRDWTYFNKLWNNEFKKINF